ncbi:MAG: hypothetical protein H6922_04980 [Pseudomonadaceae bacterium]|nr:hypothetical protein [Pseudomonadaceae bacterium]
MFTQLSVSGMLLPMERHLSFALYILALLLPVTLHAEVFYAVRSYCMAEEGRFMLEPFPIGYSASEIPAKTLEERRQQSVIAAPKTQSVGELNIECPIYKDSYKAVIAYDMRDDTNKYQRDCNKADTYQAKIKLYRNGHHILNSSFGSECPYADVSKLTVWQKDNGTYQLEVCQQSPSWGGTDPLTVKCNRLRRGDINTPLTEDEQNKLFPTESFSDTSPSIPYPRCVASISACSP